MTIAMLPYLVTVIWIIVACVALAFESREMDKNPKFVKGTDRVKIPRAVKIGALAPLAGVACFAVLYFAGLL